MGVKLKNNARSRLAASISAITVTINVLTGHGSRFPTLNIEDDWFPLAIENEAGQIEYLRCTARVGDAMTVERGAEGSEPLAFNAGDLVQLRLTAASVGLAGGGGGGSGGGYYADGTDINELRPANKGATRGAPPGTALGTQLVEEVLGQFETAKRDISSLIETYGSTAAAAASAQTAVQAKNNSETARQQAQAAVTAANDAKTLAQQSRDQASGFAASSEAAKQAATTAKQASELARDQAQVKADAAGGSASAAAGSASVASAAVTAASQSASAASASEVSAKSFASGNLVARASFDATRNKGTWSGGATSSVELDTGLGSWVLQQRDRAIVEGDAFIMGDWSNRRLRISGFAGVYGAFPAIAGVQTLLADGSIPAPVIFARPAPANYEDFGADVQLGANVRGIRPILISDGPWGAAQHGVNWRNIRIEDVTAQRTAQGYAEAAASSSSTAAISKSAAEQSAAAANSSATTAATLRSQAETFRNESANSASSAAGSFSAAQQQAGLAANSAGAANGSAAAAAGSASTAATKSSESEQSAQAANAYAISAGVKANEANQAAGSAASSASGAAASSTSAGQSASAAQISEVSAFTAAQSLMPKDFQSLRNWTYDYATGNGDWTNDSRVRAYDHGTLGRICEVINNPAFGPHFASKGRVVLVRDRVYRITAVWHLVGQQADAIVWGGLFAIGLRPDGSQFNGVNRGCSIQSGENGWGWNAWATHSLEVHSNTLLDQGCQWMRPSFRLESQGMFDLKSIEIVDITGEYHAGQSAQASASSASSAAASQSATEQNASAANSSRAAAETAAAQSAAYRDQAATSSSNAAGSASTASQAATLSAQARDASNQAANASSQSAGVASAKAIEAGQSALAAQYSEVRASNAATSANDMFARTFPSFVGPGGKEGYIYAGDNGSGFVWDYGPNSGWPQPYITAHSGGQGGKYNRITFKESVTKEVGRRYRVTSYFYNHGSNCESVGIFLLLTENNIWDGDAVGATGDAVPAGCYNGVPLNQGGFWKIGLEFTVPSSWKSKWKPVLQFVTTGGPPNDLWHFTGIQIDDITSERAAADSASAAANSASSAAIAAGDAGVQAAAAQNSSVQASVSAGTAADKAQWASDSGNWAADRASSAAGSAGYAADRANAAAGSAGYAADRANAATNSASAASSSQAVATAQASAAQTSANLAAATSLGSLNPNPAFTEYPNASAEPAYWAGWSYEGNVPSRTTGETGIGYAVREVANENVNQGGVCTGQGGLGNPLPDQWYVMEAFIRLDAGSLRGAGVWANCSSVDGSQYRGDIGGISFAADPDSAGYARGDGQAGRVYRFTKLLRGPSNPERISLHRMSNWDGFGYRAWKTLTWYRIVLRPATQQEIRDQTALQPLIAQVSQQAGVLAAIDGRTQAYLENVVSAGGKRAALRMIAGGSGSGVELQADAIRLGDDNKAAMDVVGGNVIFYGKVTAESIETQHLRVGGVDFDRLATSSVGTVKIVPDASQQVYALSNVSASNTNEVPTVVLSYTFYVDFPAKLITTYSLRAYKAGSGNGTIYSFTRLSATPNNYIATAEQTTPNFAGAIASVGMIDINPGWYTVELCMFGTNYVAQDKNLVFQVIKR